MLKESEARTLGIRLGGVVALPQRRRMIGTIQARDRKVHGAMASLQAVGKHTWMAGGGSNIGFITVDGTAIMVDAGLDGDSARKALRGLDATSARVKAVILTHGHTDHFGGAAWVAEQTGSPIYASALEGIFAQHPILEPLFLYSGACPISELRGKFTLARQGIAGFCPLEAGEAAPAGVSVQIVPLPGHAPAQIGIGFEDTLFCGDVVFPEETLAKHPILFCSNLDAWLESLTHLKALSYDWFVAGHGAVLREISSAAAATGARLREIRALVWEALASPTSSHAVLHTVASHYNAPLEAPQLVLLALTTIHAALTSLQQAGEVEAVVEESLLQWRRR